MERSRAIFQVDRLKAFDTILISHVWFGVWSIFPAGSWMYHFFGCLFLLAARKPGQGEPVHDHGPN